MDRDFKVKIETEEDFFANLVAQAEKIDQGVIPEKTVERVSFPDLATFYRYCTPGVFICCRSCTRSAASVSTPLPSICIGTTRMYSRM